MSTERSDNTFEMWRSATERFDYYVTGIAGALTAYLGQKLGPVTFSWTPAGAELCAVVSFLLAFLTGLLRIRATHAVLQLTVAMLYRQESAGAMMAKAGTGPLLNQSTGEIMPAHWIPELVAAAKKGAKSAEAEALKAATQAERWGNVTYFLLFAGLVALVGSKVWQGYINAG